MKQEPTTCNYKNCQWTSVFHLLFVCLLIMNIASGQSYQFETFSMGNTPVFTVNSFQTVAVDKRGKVWAGSTLGGLYCYRNSEWVKIATYPDITFRHAVNSNMPGDSNVWITSIGKTAAQATSGGAYHINTKTETVTQYGSGIAGGLSSRFGNSLAMSSQGQVYVALAQSLTGTTTNQGGVYKTNTVNPPPPSTTSFTRAIVDQGDIIYQSAGNRGEELWFGRGANCASGCQAPYIARLSSSGAVLPAITGQSSGLPFTSSSSSPFARAIYTDNTWGNTFVGLNNGGIGVCLPDGKWKMITSNNSPFPSGAAVNFNAISEVFGEVWIGTTAGIFVYDGFGSFDEPGSFKLLTTDNGLPSNNITDIEVDEERSDIWVTSPIGISKCHYVPLTITGFAFDVSAGTPVKDKVPNLNATLKRMPIWYDLTASLYENGVLVDRTRNSPNGKFNLYGSEGKKYKVELKYETESGDIVFEYDDIATGAYMGPILFPKTLMKEIKDFATSLASREFTQDLPFKIPYNQRLAGFLLDGYFNSYADLLSPKVVKDNHLKRVQNLGTFYCTLSTAYWFGGDAYLLKQESANNLMDFLITAIEVFDFLGSLKTQSSEDIIKEILLKKQGDMLKNIKDVSVVLLTKAANTIDDEVTKQNIIAFITIINDAIDAIVTFKENESDIAIAKMSIEFLKKIVVARFIKDFYPKYCRQYHSTMVSFSSTVCRDFFSDLSYEQSFSNLYGGLGGSVEELKKTLENETTLLVTGSKLAANGAFIADVTAKVLALTPLFELSPALIGISKGLTIAQLPLLATAATINNKGSQQIVSKSFQILPQSGFYGNPPPTTNSAFTLFNAIAKLNSAELNAAKNSCNQSVVALKSVINGTYNNSQFLNQLQELTARDSIYSSEIRKSLSRLWSVADSALVKIPGFKNQLDVLVDSFVEKQYKYRDAFFYQNLAYYYANDKNTYVPGLNQLADSIVLLNDSTVNCFVRILDSINSNSIESKAYLVKDDFKLDHSHLYGSTGTVSYKFTNYGSAAMNGVSFKMSEPDKGYAIVGEDSVYFDVIGPGQTVGVSFSFLTPSHDSVSNFTIEVKALNGIYNDVSGGLFAYDPTKFYSIRDGNWSNPNTWSRGMVPNGNSIVEVNHKVTIDVNASCKTLINGFYGEVRVEPGKEFSINQ